MATNKIGDGVTVQYTATGDVTSGQIILGTNRCYIALAAGATGAVIECAKTGTWSVTKATATSEGLTFGDQVYAKATGTVVKASATGTVPLGHADAAAATGATLATVTLGTF